MPHKSKYRNLLLAAVAALSIYIVLLIPWEKTPVITLPSGKAFLWNSDSLWVSLENNFIIAARQDSVVLKRKIDTLLRRSQDLLIQNSEKILQPGDTVFHLLEEKVFEIAPLIPSCSQKFPDYLNFYSDLRRFVKAQSVHWNVNSTGSRNTLYRLLYGNRTAIEEIMLQLEENKVHYLIKGTDEPSAAPSAKILGVEVHSGDILVSRGGAPTSALIARGNDYAGNFSHIALVYIDPQTNLVSVIESHIERGVVVSTLDQYLKDVKLRVMILRLRSDLIKQDPLLPHKAAKYALDNASGKHIPYDFEMDYLNSDKQFCSEVASSAYQQFGIRLWSGFSTISSIGTRNWLAAFGVRNFQTFEPSDLEYDPQITVVAEWRDPMTLYKDHIDNAVTDVMLEDADSGAVLKYDWYLLPAARILKVYSSLINLFGLEGPIPEGMSPEAALRNKKYSSAHEEIKKRLLLSAEKFRKQNGYRPPYWKLVTLARNIRDEIKE